MPLQKQIILLIIVLFSSFFSTEQLYSETSIIPDSIKVNVLPQNQIALTDSIINYGKIFLNTPYRYGSSGVNSFDCSGFTSFVYRNFGFNLERSSFDQGRKVDTVDRCKLKTGDLVFFSGRHKSHRIGHVGIVVSANGNGKFKFIHASVRNGVIISDSDEPYYSKRFIKAGRVVFNDQMLVIAPNSSVRKTVPGTFAQNFSNPISIPDPENFTKKIIPAKYHFVKKGETLSSIAMKYGISIARLKQKNHIKGNRINPRQRIKIQDGETVLLADATLPPKNNITDLAENKIESQNKTEATENKDITSYTVKKGESLFSISRLYNISVEKLKEINNLISSKLKLGQKILLPQYTTAATTNLIDDKSDQKIDNTEMTQQPKTTPIVVTHIVKKGENLFNIAKDNNMSVSELEKINNLSGNKLHIGQKLHLTQSSENEDKNPVEDKTINKTEVKQKTINEDTHKTSVHKVKKGESLYTIAHKFNMSVDELKERNKLNGNRIKFGQKLVVNQSNQITSESSESKTQSTPKIIHHKVKSGESFYSIARKYGCKMNELKEWNNKSGNKLKVGDKIIVYQKAD
jgi:LysM repeat protein